MIYAGITGYFTALSLIVVIGAQNALVLRQGLAKSHVLVCVLFCAMSDAILISVGVFGFSQISAEVAWFKSAMTVFGIVFLVGYGAMRVRAVLYSDYRNELEGAPVSVLKILAILVGVTWLNPHVYLDTVVLIGAVSTQFDGAGARFAFWICASFASFSFFFTLGYGAKLVAPMMGRARFWRILDAGIAGFMFCLAGALLLTISY